MRTNALTIINGKQLSSAQQQAACMGKSEWVCQTKRVKRQGKTVERWLWILYVVNP